MFSWRAWPTLERDPRMQVMAARRRLKFSCARNHPSTVLYDRSRFSASSEAKCFRKVVVSGLAPPEVLNTSGVKKALSNLRIRSSYLFHLAHLCSMGHLDGRCLHQEGIVASLPKNPLTLMSRRASSSLVVACQWKVSPVSGCMSGSMGVLKQTSEMSIAIWQVLDLIVREG